VGKKKDTDWQPTVLAGEKMNDEPLGKDQQHQLRKGQWTRFGKEGRLPHRGGIESLSIGLKGLLPHCRREDGFGESGPAEKGEKQTF